MYKLAQLIKAQKQIKYLVIESHKTSGENILPGELKEAILTHSQSIIFYESYGNENNFNNLFNYVINIYLIIFY